MDAHEYNIQLATLRHPIARDLWWVLASEPILFGVPGLPQHSEEERTEMCLHVLPFIRTIEALSLEDAAKAIGVEGWRVGLYFEALVAAIIRAHPSWTLLGKDVQIRGEGRTLGAFDFVVRTGSGLCEHWEVAVKFYLRFGDSKEWKYWLGPNQRDRLDKKVNRMRHHQLPLSRRPEAVVPLEQIGASSVERHVALLKGVLFVEWGSMPVAPPNGTRVPTGRWVAESQVTEVNRAVPEGAWVRRDKPYWLAPSLFDSDETLSATLPARVSRPEMWSRLVQSGTHWREVERWFVVPDRWKEWRG